VTNTRLAAPLALLLTWATAQTPAAAQHGSVEVDTVRVAPPTGERGADRASILAALAAVREGGTIKFAAGTYLIGEMISIPTPGISLIGHPDGTTLRGCNPEDVAGMQEAREACNGLELAGAGQTVRRLTFEHAFWALHLGCCFNDRTTYDFPDGSTHELPTVRRGEGGHVVEGNTFRSSLSGIRVNGGWTEPSIVRGNRFIDNWHAVSINGHTVHVLDNRFSVPQPERVPDYGYAWDAIKIAPPMPIQGESSPPACIGNVVAGNTIEGYVDGIRLEVYLPGSICRENVIRDNTITVRRAHNPSGDQFRYGGDPSDSSVVGVPIALLNDPIFSEYAGSDAPTVVEENTVEGNRILGAEGIGIEVLRASRNRVAGNVIERVVAREPFPGNTMAGTPDAWRHANGSGIWISPGSEANLLEGNAFEGIAHASVVREGEVETDDGARLYYRVEGEGRDTVVVLHGGPSLGLAYLAPDLVPLAHGRAVVHYDQRGIGRSTPVTEPERLSVEWHVQDLDALRADLGLERLSLLGHSWGGMLAARYAAAHPERVERILLLDPMAPAREPFMAMAGARAREMVRARMDEPARARLDSLAATAEVADPGELCRERYALLTPIFFEDPAAAARSRADFCAGTPVTLRNRPEVDAAIFGSLGEWDVRPALGHVGSPVLVVRGAEGAIPREAMEAWAEAFPNARLLTIEGGGHYLHVDRPEVFFPAAETFFGGGWPEADNHPAPVDSVDAFILGRMAELGIPGVSVAVLRGSEVVKLASYGRANLELDVPASSSTAFPFASITKAFTGTAMLRLVERDLLALDDRVGELLPELPEAWSEVTVRQLLSHTSGLPDVARMEEAISNPLVLRDMLFATTRDSAMAVLPTMPLSFEAGRSVAYNQTNYMLVAMLLERLDGRTIEDFVRDEFTQPLGLTSLVFGDSRAVMPGRASWYTRLDYSTGRPVSVPVQPVWVEYPSFLHTTAGLNGTALDLARFVAAVASGDLLGEAARGEMWGGAQLADGSAARMGPFGVALGWLTDDRAGRSVWMGGAESGAVRYFIDEDLTVAVLTNLMGAGPYGLVDGVAEACLAGERRAP
jgi:proline iminopeptidase